MQKFLVSLVALCCVVPLVRADAESDARDANTAAHNAKDGVYDSERTLWCQLNSDDAKLTSLNNRYDACPWPNTQQGQMDKQRCRAELDSANNDIRDVNNSAVKWLGRMSLDEGSPNDRLWNSDNALNAHNWGEAKDWANSAMTGYELCNNDAAYAACYLETCECSENSADTIMRKYGG